MERTIDMAPDHAPVEIGQDTARHPTAQAILEAAIRDMDQSGEGSIRITRVLEESGAAYGSLYHHFGSREALVKEAIVERYLRSVQAGLARFGEALLAVTTEAELRDLLDAELERIGTPDLRDQRRRRVNALGSAAIRPDILLDIASHQALYFDGAGAAIATLQQRGLIDPDLDPRTFASWYLGLVLSRFLVDIDPRPGSTEGWTALTRSAVLHLLSPRSPE